MTPAELLAALVRLNVFLAIALVVVLTLRLPWRKMFGAQAAYALWLAAPAALAAAFLPRRAPPAEFMPIPVAETPQPAAQVLERLVTPITAAAEAPASLAGFLVALWGAGALAGFLWLAFQQSRFNRQVALGRAGPAVAGFLAPRIILPSDFEGRFDAGERQVILAHEQVHLGRHDARINGLMALLQCLFWFNPLLHVAARALRVDQELACDARVAADHPLARGHYAQAMLKTQLARTPLPLGCFWPGGEHPLTERIAMLKHPSPSRSRRSLGLVAVTSVVAISGYGFWSLAPAQASSVRAGVAVSMLPPAPLPPGFAFDEMPLINVMEAALYIGDQETSLRRLSGDIARLYPATGHEDPVFFRAEASVSYREVMGVLNHLQDAGYANLMYLAEDF